MMDAVGATPTKVGVRFGLWVKPTQQGRLLSIFQVLLLKRRTGAMRLPDKR